MRLTEVKVLEANGIIGKTFKIKPIGSINNWNVLYGSKKMTGGPIELITLKKGKAIVQMVKTNGPNSSINFKKHDGVEKPSKPSYILKYDQKEFDRWLKDEKLPAWLSILSLISSENSKQIIGVKDEIKRN